MCLAQGPKCSDAGEARTRGPSSGFLSLLHGVIGMHHQFKILVFFLGHIHLLDICIQNCHLRRYIIGFMVGN